MLLVNIPIDRRDINLESVFGKVVFTRIFAFLKVEFTKGRCPIYILRFGFSRNNSIGWNGLCYCGIVFNNKKRHGSK